MNIQIQPNGVLRITAESETEVFALQEWMNKAHKKIEGASFFKSEYIGIVKCNSSMSNYGTGSNRPKEAFAYANDVINKKLFTAK